MIQYLYGLDSGILIWIQENLVHNMLTPVVVFLTSIGNSGIIWILLSALLCAIPKTRKIGILCFVALACTFLVNNVVLKNLVARTRPYDALNQVKLLINAQKDYSFPSGHTGSAFAVANVLFFSVKKRYGIPCMLFAGLMGFTRLYVGVHYPSDVIAAAFIGTVIGYFVVKVRGKCF